MFWYCVFRRAMFLSCASRCVQTKLLTSARMQVEIELKAPLGELQLTLMSPSHLYPLFAPPGAPLLPPYCPYIPTTIQVSQLDSCLIFQPL